MKNLLPLPFEGDPLYKRGIKGDFGVRGKIVGVGSPSPLSSPIKGEEIGSLLEDRGKREELRIID